ncbi:MAG TPA: DUF4160 domain-containing protein [Rhizomicrobium sp.]|nr:DUF4160 domain-containing protein [Rhizomicrobium sp.]
MVTVHRGSNWKIAVYAREHGIPHFHIEGPDFRCSVAIATLDLIVGNVPPNILGEARWWARKNRALLTARWLELNA